MSEILNRIRNRILADDYSHLPTRDEAFEAARKNGDKTFLYKNKHYNTDYSSPAHKQYEADVKSGKDAAFQKAYPNYTNPYLVKAKQEELDVYGNTNEMTRNRTWFENNLLNNLDTKNGYEDAGNAMMGIGDFRFELTGGNEEDADLDYDVYYDEDGNPHGVYNPQTKVNSRPQVTPTDRTKSAVKLAESVLGLKQHRRKPFVGEPDPHANITDQELSIEYDLFNNLLGKPSVYNKFKVSKFKPSNLSRSQTSTKPYYLDVGDYTHPGGNSRNTTLENIYSLGDYTISNGSDRGKGFDSYHDVWDINPFGQGNVSNLLGTPIHIYGRRYQTQEPDVKAIYDNFKHK